MGKIEEKIINLLNSKLNPSILKVVNESHMHNVPEGSESHFKPVSYTHLTLPTNREV